MDKNTDSGKKKEALVDLPKSEIYKAIDLDTNLVETEENGTPVTVIGLRFGNLVFEIEQFVEKILGTEDVGFEELQTPRGKSYRALPPLGSAFSLMMAFIGEYSPCYEYSPHVELFFKSVDEMNLWGDYFQIPGRESFSSTKSEEQLFNDLILLIRKKGRSSEFTDDLALREFNGEKAFDSMVRYTDAIITKYSRVLVLRVDLGYLAEFSDISIEEAQEHLSRLLNNRRSNKLFKQLVGYIWRLEYGGMKGHHFHLIFYFDGSLVHKDAFIADEIGKYWTEVITKGKGVYFNCNRKAHKYSRCGIGMVSHDDAKMRENLLIALRYLVKAEQFLRVREGKRVRAFGRGEIPRLKHSGLGRPRRVGVQREGLQGDPTDSSRKDLDANR
jgi:hypothetical protein